MKKKVLVNYKANCQAYGRYFSEGLEAVGISASSSLFTNVTGMVTFVVSFASAASKYPNLAVVEILKQVSVGSLSSTVVAELGTKFLHVSAAYASGALIGAHIHAITQTMMCNKKDYSRWEIIEDIFVKKGHINVPMSEIKATFNVNPELRQFLDRKGIRN